MVEHLRCVSHNYMEIINSFGTTAFGGFKKQEVVAYIEELVANYTADIKNIEDKHKQAELDIRELKELVEQQYKRIAEYDDHATASKAKGEELARQIANRDMQIAELEGELDSVNIALKNKTNELMLLSEQLSAFETANGSAERMLTEAENTAEKQVNDARMAANDMLNRAKADCERMCADAEELASTAKSNAERIAANAEETIMQEMTAAKHELESIRKDAADEREAARNEARAIRIEADRLKQEAEREVAQQRVQAMLDVESADNEAKDNAAETIAKAKETADAAIAGAQQAVENMKHQAVQQCAAYRSQAEKQAEEIQANALRNAEEIRINAERHAEDIRLKAQHEFAAEREKYESAMRQVDMQKKSILTAIEDIKQNVENMKASGKPAPIPVKPGKPTTASASDILRRKFNRN